MPAFVTDLGRTITAATQEAAAVLAAQYGMGTIMGRAQPAARPAKKGPPLRYGVWDDLTQSWEEGPCSLAELAASADQWPDSAAPCVYRGEYTPGRRLTAAEWAAFSDGTE